jgi:hypothetical protein
MACALAHSTSTESLIDLRRWKAHRQRISNFLSSPDQQHSDVRTNSLLQDHPRRQVFDANGAVFHVNCVGRKGRQAVKRVLIEGGMELQVSEGTSVVESLAF